MTAPLVRMPCRSSSVRASACSRLVGSGSGSGSSDHRPVTVGGPVRLAIPMRPEPGLRVPMAARLAGRAAAPSPDRPARRRACPAHWTCPRPFDPGAPVPARPSGPPRPSGLAVATGRPEPRTVRSGARVSLVSRPAHTRSQIAAATALLVRPRRSASGSSPAARSRRSGRTSARRRPASRAPPRGAASW